MHTIRGLFQAITIMALAGILFVTAPPVHASGTTFVVNTNINIAGDDLCSLEEAIKAGNQTTGGEDCDVGSTTEPDIIHFNLPVGQRTITLATQQVISGPLIIDGASQPGYAGTPVVHITGTMSYMFWLEASAGGSTVKGIKFSNTKAAADCGDGIALYFNGSSNNVVSGNYFHTNGTRSLGTCGKGVWMVGTSNNNMIGGSTAAKGKYFGGVAGIEISSGTGNTIQGNYFGVKRGGNARLDGLPATREAISIGSYSGSVDANIIRGNVIGSHGTGIYLYANTIPSNNTHVVGNKIGVGADGTSVISNGWGIHLVGTADNTIGGTAAADRNVVSANTIYNIAVDANSVRNLIRGNYIGTDAAGLHAAVLATSAVPGIMISGSDETEIGGTEPGSGNVISGNETGIYICCAAASTTILGNKIGTDKNGARAIPNTSGIAAYSVDVNIGDAGTPGNNLISGNGNGEPGFYGIFLSNTPVGTTVYGNKIGLSSAGETAIRNGTGIALDGLANAAIWGNWIARSVHNGVSIGSTSSVQVSSLNCFTGNGEAGVNNGNLASASFISNWWGSASGPTDIDHNPLGTGDAAVGEVDYSGFLPAPPAICANRLINSSFETDADHNNKPDNWTYAGFNAATDKRDCTIRKAGSCSLKFAGNGLLKTASQTLLYSGLAGDDIGLSVWSKANSIPAGSAYRLQMNVYSGTTPVDAKSANFTVGTHAFQQAAIRYTAAANFDKIVVKIVFTATSGEAWFDLAFHGWAP